MKKKMSTVCEHVLQRAIARIHQRPHIPRAGGRHEFHYRRKRQHKMRLQSVSFLRAYSLLFFAGPQSILAVHAVGDVHACHSFAAAVHTKHPVFR